MAAADRRRVLPRRVVFYLLRESRAIFLPGLRAPGTMASARGAP
jgi:hypothetical protein